LVNSSINIAKNINKNCRNFGILKSSKVFENNNYKKYRQSNPIKATNIALGTAISGSRFYG
jgi:hypothetical protein